MSKDKIRLGHVIVEFGTNGNLTGGNLLDFFGCVSAIDTLTVRGLVGEIAENLQSIKEKLSDCGVFVSQINVEVTV